MKKYTDIADLEFLSETALESSLAGYWDWDMVTNSEYLSPRFKEMFGYADHEMENSPEAWQKVAFQEDLAEMFEAFTKHVESKGIIPFNSVVRYHHKDGSTVWVRCNGKVVSWSAQGQPLRAIGCHVDITEEKERELELERVIEEKNVLLGEVHHRVKNNLQLIQSLARLRQKEGSIEIQEIENSINAIASAHEAIYRADRFDSIDLKEYLERIVTPLILGHGIDFKIGSGDIRERIQALLQIGLIVTECVNNSLKHAFNNNDKQNKIEINIEKMDEKMLFTYSDNGCGFHHSILESVEQLESFGIQLIHSLAEQIGGKIELSNNEGAQVKLTLEKLG